MTLKIESTSSFESEKIIRDFLGGRYSGVLATADKAANPYATVVYFMLEDDFSVLFGTKEETQKYKNMVENDQVALLVYEERTQATAQITGRVEVVEDEAVREKVLNNMSQSSLEGSGSAIAPAEQLVAGSFKVMRLKPSVIKMAEYNRPTPGSDDLFERILFSDN